MMYRNILQLHRPALQLSRLATTKTVQPLERLPPATFAQNEEFTDNVSSARLSAVPHKVLTALFATRELFSSGHWLRIGGALSVAYGLAVYEATVLLDLWREVSIDADQARFCLRYGVEQILPGFTWFHSPPELVAASLGLDPGTILPTHILDSGNIIYDQVHASNELKVANVRSFRYVYSSIVLLSTVMSTVSHTLSAKDEVRSKILKGRRPFPREPAKILRLCGKTSSTTELALDRFPSHIIPVFEDVDLCTDIVWRHSRNFTRAVFWHVPANCYSEQWVWRNFEMWPEYLLKTNTKQRLLYMEADATNTQDCLSLGRPSADLSLEAASQGFAQIEKMIQKRNAEASKKILFRPFRVFLGDTHQLLLTGGGVARTLRQRIEERAEMNVVIDSQAIMLHEVLKWCRRQLSEPNRKDDGDEHEISKKIPKKILRFETSEPNFFNPLSALLDHFGYTVVDHCDSSACSSAPVLIHFPTTGETVNAVRALLKANALDPSRTLVVLEHAWGGREIQRMGGEGMGEVTVLCSAEVYDDVLRQVRGWVRIGHSDAAIQSELDARFGYIMENIFGSMGGNNSARIAES